MEQLEGALAAFGLGDILRCYACQTVGASPLLRPFNGRDPFLLSSV
jgi:hypothetical protein